VDLRVFDNCLKVAQGCEHVFNLAADMGGMGFIQSNHSVIMYNNTMIRWEATGVARGRGRVGGRALCGSSLGQLMRPTAVNRAIMLPAVCATKCWRPAGLPALPTPLPTASPSPLPPSCLPAPQLQHDGGGASGQD
jgi:hypothetical protein